MRSSWLIAYGIEFLRSFAHIFALLTAIPLTFLGHGQEWTIGHNVSRWCTHLERTHIRSVPSLDTFNPFTADPVKALHFAIQV